MKWSTYFGRNIPTEIRKENEFKMTRAIDWPGLIGKCRSIFLRYYRWSPSGQFGLMESTQQETKTYERENGLSQELIGQ